MTKIPRDASTVALVRAIEANELARFARLSRLLGGEFHRGSRLTWFLTGMPYLLFNGVLSACLPPDDLARRIARALAPFAARTLPMFWMTGPSTQPADLGQRLLAARLSDPGELVGMAADLSALREDWPAPPDLVIERVGELSALTRWIGAFSAGFGYPADVGRSFFAVFAVSQPHDADLRVGEDGARDHAVVDPLMCSGEGVVGGDGAIARTNRGRHLALRLAADHVAGCPDMRHTRAQLLIYEYRSGLLVEPDADRLET